MWQLNGKRVGVSEMRSLGSRWAGRVDGSRERCSSLGFARRLWDARRVLVEEVLDDQLRLSVGFDAMQLCDLLELDASEATES